MNRFMAMMCLMLPFLFSTECNPEWSFERIDGQDGTISSGFNFRAVTYDTSEGSRSLSKLWGIRFVFVTEGTAGKFNFAALTVTFGGKPRQRALSELSLDSRPSKLYTKNGDLQSF